MATARTLVGRTKALATSPAARAQLVQFPSKKVITWALPKLKGWFLFNTDSREALWSQFESENIRESVSSSYANTFALNRQKAITQFLHGNVETIQFTARFYAVFALQPIARRIEKLKSWVRLDSALRRPPILYFWVGNQHVKMKSCVLTSVNVEYDRAGFAGSMQGATVSITLQQYEPFSLQDTESFDTFYHFAKTGDSYELLAQKFYGNALLGVELRDRHPKVRRLFAGARVKIPAPAGSIRTVTVAPKSIALKGLTSRRINPQLSNLRRVLALRSVPSVSYGVS